MKKQYDTFVSGLNDLPEGQEISLTVRDLTPGRHKYESSYVKAVVSSSTNKLPDGDVLWLRFQRGSRHPQPWAIKILTPLGDYMPRDVVGVRT